MKHYALEITAHTGSGLTTLYFSTGPALVTGASDTPPNFTFDGRLVQPGNYSIQAFQGGLTYGRSQVGYGEIVLNNRDGELDVLLDYGFDGRTAVLRMHEEDDGPVAYPAGWKTVYTGTVEQPEAFWPGYGDGTIVLRMRDRMAELHVKLPLSIYAGDNVLPAGLEGTADDLKGKTKPLLLGKCFNMPLQCVNTSRLIYAVSPPTGGLIDVVTDWDAIADFDAVADFFGSVVSGPVLTPIGIEYRRGGCSSTGVAVYDSGVLLTKGADYTDETDMMTNAPAAGAYRVWSAHGYIRLGSSPAGEITCTATDNNGNDANTVGSIIRCVLRDYLGWDRSRYNITELAALDTAAPVEMGWMIKQDTYVDELLDVLCSSAGACYYFDQYGVFRIFQVTDPQDSSADIPMVDKISSITLSSATGIPKNAIRIRHSKNWQVQSGGLAGSVGAEWRSWVAQEWRENIAKSAATAEKHLLSDELAFDTAFVADSATETTRRLGLYSVRRDLFDIDLLADVWSTDSVDDWDAIADFDAVESIDRLDFTAFRIGQVLAVGLDGRYGYTSKNMLLTGIQADLVQDKITLTVWG